jgi:hypothetical protein
MKQSREDYSSEVTGILVAQGDFSSGGESCFSGEENAREALRRQIMGYCLNLRDDPPRQLL